MVEIYSVPREFWMSLDRLSALSQTLRCFFKTTLATEKGGFVSQKMQTLRLINQIRTFETKKNLFMKLAAQDKNKH